MHRQSAAAITPLLLLALLGLSGGAEHLRAQCTPPPLRTWIRFADNGTCFDTLWFGFDWQATCGIDLSLWEIEQPPLPPAGVCDFRFVNIPGREGAEPPAGLGRGTRQDYRNEESYPIRLVDTFMVRLQPGDGGYPIGMRWTAAGIRSIADSALLTDEFGGILFQRAMHRESTAVLVHPAITRLLIIIRRVFVGDNAGGHAEPGPVPVLHSHPNPFNPSTDLGFELPERAHVVLTVHDLLGRVVARLAEAPYPRGSHSIRWDAEGQAAGTYLARFIAVTERDRQTLTQTRKLLLIR